MSRCKGGTEPQFQGILPTPESRDRQTLCNWDLVGEGAAYNSVASEAFVAEASMVASYKQTSGLCLSELLLLPSGVRGGE